MPVIFEKGLALMAAFAIVPLTAGCDSAAPPAGTEKLSVAERDTVRMEDNFENLDAWETFDGTWAVGKIDDRAVMKQTAVDRKFPLTLLRKPKFSDVDVTVEFRPISGRVDASGGLVFCALDGANYYVVRANSLEDNFRLYATVAGSRNQIASTKIAAPEIGKWHALRVVATGNRMQAYLNGELLIDHRDSRFTVGRVGLWTKADAVTEFADFKASGIVESN